MPTLFIRPLRRLLQFLLPNRVRVGKLGRIPSYRLSAHVSRDVHLPARPRVHRRRRREGARVLLQRRPAPPVAVLHRSQMIRRLLLRAFIVRDDARDGQRFHRPSSRHPFLLSRARRRRVPRRELAQQSVQHVTLPDPRSSERHHAHRGARHDLKFRRPTLRFLDHAASRAQRYRIRRAAAVAAAARRRRPVRGQESSRAFERAFEVTVLRASE